MLTHRQGEREVGHLFSISSPAKVTESILNQLPRQHTILNRSAEGEVKSLSRVLRVHIN